MVTEEEIKILAYNLWETEGRPNDKDMEHYFRAKRILEEQSGANPPLSSNETPPIAGILPSTPSPLPKTRGKPWSKKKTR